MIVAGSSVYKSANPREAIAIMRRSVERYGNGAPPDTWWRQLQMLAIPVLFLPLLHFAAQ